MIDTVSNLKLILKSYENTIMFIIIQLFTNTLSINEFTYVQLTINNIVYTEFFKCNIKHCYNV